MADQAPDWAQDVAPGAPAASAAALAPDWARDNASVPTTSAWDAGAHGFVSGAAAGWNDEIAGVRAAGQQALGMPTPTTRQGMLLQPAGSEFQVGLAELVREYLTGQRGPATQAYEQTRDQVRAAERTMREQHPYAFGAGQFGGAVTTMVAAPEAGAATWPARLMQGAKIGATYGGLQAAGESEADNLGRLLADTASGVAAGGVGGAAGAGVGTVLEKAASVGYDYLGRPLVSLARGLIDPDAEASRRVVGALARDYPQIARGTAAGLTPGEFAGAAAAGEPLMVADMGGETTRALLRSAANTSTEGRNVINAAVQGRFQDQAERVAADIRGLVSGGANAPRTRAELQAAYDAQRGAAYRAAYDAGDRPLWSPTLERLTGSRSVVGAIRNAVETGNDRSIGEGYGAFNPGVAVTDDGRLVFNRGANGVPTYPNLQFWDYAYRNLRDSASAAARAGRNEEAGSLGTLATQMRTELDRLVPAYRNARGVAADFFGGTDALDAGAKAAKFTGDPQVLAAQIAKMKPAELNLFREGYADAKANAVLNMADNRDVTSRLYNSPNERARMAAVFGPDALGPIETRLRLERIMDMARTALGNSTTARQLIEAGLAGGGIGAYLDGWHGGLAGMGAGLAGARLARVGAQKLIGYVDQNTARRVAELLTSSDPRVLRQGIQLASKNAGVARGLRDMEQRLLAATGAQQAPNMAAGAARMLPSVLPAGAQEQQHKRGGRVDEKQHDGDVTDAKGFAQGGRAAGRPHKGPPVRGARKAPDGHWYVRDKMRPGKFLRVIG